MAKNGCSNSWNHNYAIQFERKLRLDQAELGLENIKKNVDALIVINNNKLREVYGNLGFKLVSQKLTRFYPRQQGGLPR